VSRAAGSSGALCMKSSSAMDLEGFLLARFRYAERIYYHHTLRALECMVRGAFEEALDEGLHLPETPCDWMRTREEDLLPPRLRSRSLIKSCLILKRTTVQQDSIQELSRLAVAIRDRNVLRKLRQSIYDEIPARVRTSFADLWVDSPPLPATRQARSWLIQMSREKVVPWGQLSPFTESFSRLTDDSIEVRVLYSDNPDGRRLVADVATEILARDYGIKVRPLARDLALKGVEVNT